MLSIKDKVNAIIYVETFIIRLANPVINKVLNHLIKGTWDVKRPSIPVYLACELTP